MKSKNNSINFSSPLHPHIPKYLKSFIHHKSINGLRLKFFYIPTPTVFYQSNTIEILICGYIDLNI
ncbi:TPA: hypothetical protein ACJHIP_002001, partial [Staphylococcus pseudintermedius]